jgi:hypothetical protein
LGPGNPECVPVVGNTNPSYSISASYSGWVRGKPVGLSTATIADCCNVKNWTGWDNSAGPYQGKQWRDGWQNEATGECCEITSDTINYVGGTWSASCTMNSLVSSSNTFNLYGSVAPFFTLCNTIVAGNMQTCAFCGGCCGVMSGLYDVVGVNLDGRNLTDPFYPFQKFNNLGQAVCDPPYDSDYPSQYAYGPSVNIYYAKPVPFTATRTLTGVYTKYLTEVLFSSNYYRGQLNPVENWEYLISTGCFTYSRGLEPDRPWECVCGTGNGLGITAPSTLTLS